jgi:opacity protein-like surface antigen
MVLKSVPDTWLASFLLIGIRGADIMRKRIVRGMQVVLWTLAIMTVVAPATADAQIRRVSSSSDSRQAIGFNIGYFSVKGEDSRDEDDVIFRDLDSLLFDVSDFNGVTFGAEWLYGVTDYIEVGAGINYYQGSVSSIYADFFEDDGSEIEQELKLRQVPMTATVRFLPVGRRASVQPYIGAGIGAIRWRYTETGEFVDFEGIVFRDSFEADGTEIGPVILGGIRFPVGDALLAGGEFRWHSAEGDTGGIDEGFLGDKIDLGGWSANFTLHFRF